MAVSSSIKCFAAGSGGEHDGLLVSVIDEYCIDKEKRELSSSGVYFDRKAHQK